MKKINLLILPLLMAQTLFSQDQSNWSHVGPKKIGTGTYETGRLDVIVPHPGYNGTSNDTIYAGGSNGGLWYTVNGGTNWLNISTNFMRYSGVGDMAFTSDGRYLYIADRISMGTNKDRGSGVYKYKRSGGSWTEAGTSQSTTNTLATPLGEQLKSNHIKIHPTDNNYIYLATNTGLYVTTTGGTGTASWGTQPKVAGNFENIAFVPNPAAIGLYDIYISGMNTIMKSSDKGATFSAIPTPSPNNPFTSYTNPYFDMAYGGIDADGTSKILFFQGYVASPATYAIYKYKIPTSGSPTMTLLLADGTDGPEIDRMCIAGDKNIVYYGGTKLTKYNLSTSTAYDPLPTVSPFTDIALSPGSFPYYYYGDSEPYLTMLHSDLHDIKIFDNTTTHKIFAASDGGFSVDTYTTTPTTGVYTNSWTYKNNGLHIASINGFSGSEMDTDVYATGEQDTKGFVFNEAMTKIVSFGVEPRMVLLDKARKIQANGDKTFRVFHNYRLSEPLTFGNPSLYIDDVTFPVTGPATKTSATTYLYECDNTVNYFKASSTVSTSIRLPQCNMYYQDPVRPQNIYNFSGGIWKLDEATQRFGLKYRTGKFLSAINPLRRDHGMASVVNSMAVSRTNKNKVYLAADCDFDLFAAQIYRYIGPDIDNSWGAHNDTDWELITPDLNAAPFNCNMSNTEFMNTLLNSLVMSDWDENKLWVIVSWSNSLTNVPNHPELKVLKYENGAWTNYSQGIPLKESAASMVYERGSNDCIYLATDHNIYYRTASMLQWELYNNVANAVPHAFIRQMEINYNENTLRAGTYGRGIWKTNLNCPTSGNTKNGCTNCNSSTDYFWEGTTVSISNTTLTTSKQIVRAVNVIDILPETTFDPLGNTNTYYEFFIHGCGPGSKNSFRTYKDFNPDTNEEEEDEMESGDQLSAYPNPNNGEFTLNTGNFETKDVYVYDVLGKIVYQKNRISEKTLDINISYFPKGIYMVQVVSADKTKTIKIVNE
jgi:hypothetical protein